MTSSRVNRCDELERGNRFPVLSGKVCEEGDKFGTRGSEYRKRPTQGGKAKIKKALLNEKWLLPVDRKRLLPRQLENAFGKGEIAGGGDPRKEGAAAGEGIKKMEQKEGDIHLTGGGFSMGGEKTSRSIGNNGEKQAQVIRGGGVADSRRSPKGKGGGGPIHTFLEARGEGEPFAGIAGKRVYANRESAMNKENTRKGGTKQRGIRRANLDLH